MRPFQVSGLRSSTVSVCGSVKQRGINGAWTRVAAPVWQKLRNALIDLATSGYRVGCAPHTLIDNGNIQPISRVIRQTKLEIESSCMYMYTNSVRSDGGLPRKYLTVKIQRHQAA